MTRPLLFILGTSLLAPALVAQEPARPAAGWDGARAMELVRRAQERRAETSADTALASYRADARGYVYFYLDRRDTGERTLVKTDQVALDVFWKAPAFSKQRIVGLRDEKKLPTRINYHLDHLSVVQDNFGDRIRLGDGDEVRDVLHPAAPGAERFYTYRVADSLSIRLPGAGEPVRVYELQVRPRDMGQPAFLGSVFVDQRRGDLVRMDFTFTPSSYVDRYLDYINISLDNGLWKERYWLPNQQRVEIRRQLPELDFPAGGVIRGTMRVSNYRFNDPIPDEFFRGPQVVAVPRAQREAFAFERGLYEELREEGIGPDTELAEVRRQAMALARARMLSGLPASRLDVGTASEVLRYNRAEGAVVGAGVALRPSEALTARVRGGWAFGAEHPLAEAEVQVRRPRMELTAAGYLHTPRDLGVSPVASGVLNTFSSLLAGEDYSDPYYTSGVGLSAERALRPGWKLGAGVRLEEHESAALASDFSVFGRFRPVRPVDEGAVLAASLGLERSGASGAGRSWSLALRSEIATMDPGGWDVRGAMTGTGRSWTRSWAEAGWIRRWTPRDAALELGGSTGFASGSVPVQGLFYLGGRGTIPGYDLRSLAGDRFALTRATASADLAAPWLRGRVFGAAGWTRRPFGEGPWQGWPDAPGDGARASVGAGLGIFYDILRVDLARGLGAGGRWELVVETRPEFWDFL
ncbi:MAG TPA: hypothetical protein VGR37_23265 [Longimicrobiaceae bacterium]|nr:hypothetical protein [Longimicrobiaceae bacterium]